MAVASGLLRVSIFTPQGGHRPSSLSEEVVGDANPALNKAGRCPPYKFLSGNVANSNVFRNANACSRFSPHILCTGLKPKHTCGRSDFPKMRQLFSSLNCTHRTPAGLPSGMPGIGDEMDGAIQQAPQPSRQLSIVSVTLNQAEMYIYIVRFYWAMTAFSATISTMIWQSVHARTRSAI